LRAAEQENDRGIEELSGRVAALRGITVGIHSEAEAHNRLLDGIDSSMDTGRGALAGTLGRFTKAMEDSKNRRLFWGVVGGAVALVLLFKILH